LPVQSNGFLDVSFNTRNAGIFTGLPGKPLAGFMGLPGRPDRENRTGPSTPGI
jgi:hypothetical protein